MSALMLLNTSGEKNAPRDCAKALVVFDMQKYEEREFMCYFCE